MKQETKTKLFKTIKGAAIAGGGVALVYVLQAISQMDFGQYSALAAGLSAILINATKEFLRSYEQ